MTRTRERHAAIWDLLAAGHSLSAISRILGLDRQTVQRFAREPDVAELLVKATSRDSKLDPFKPCINQRWNDGITDAAALHAELQARGWTGQRAGRAPLRAPVPRVTAAPPPGPAVPKARQITRWLLSRPASLDAGEQAQLAGIHDRCPHLNALAAHVSSFAEMMTRRRGQQRTGRLARRRRGRRPARTALLRQRHPPRPARRHQRAHPALQLRRRRGQRQPDQDDQTTDVRPRRLRPAPQARHPAPWVTRSRNSRQSQFQ